MENLHGIVPQLKNVSYKRCHQLSLTPVSLPDNSDHQMTAKK